ncbi:staphylopine uptake ABC transporter permease subunit CntC [Cohnella sp. GCM10027633]|uniref:staphylopine uptake ABC transporter permease subunit CntC n=1 Tax=unclassified Cohnella TaxID=2636738 RepID=UPI003635365F
MTFLNRLFRDKMAACSAAVVSLVVVAGLLAPWFAPHDPFAVRMELRYAGPSWSYWLGNDQLGRCVLSRLIYGIRPSVLWVLAALASTVAIGAIVGLLAGYFRGVTDAVLMRACDVMLSFPGYVMTLAMIGILGVGLDKMMIAIVVSKWAWFARVIRTSVMHIAENDYVKFAKAIGASPLTIMFRHVVPVSLPDIAVISSSSFGSMILQLSGFSFLGLGIQAPNPEWGMMLNEARGVMFSKPELMLAPGLAIIVVVCAINWLSDSLQTALDPKLIGSKPDRKQRAFRFPGTIRGREAA